MKMATAVIVETLYISERHDYLEKQEYAIVNTIEYYSIDEAANCIIWLCLLYCLRNS
jgi:hypothetical protein